jgi:hypothetical protein
MATPILNLSDIQEASPLAHIVANTNFRILEAMAGQPVVDMSLTAPPGSPAEGSLYFVAATATGAWAGHDEEFAVYVQGAWYFPRAPWTGERRYDSDSAAWVEWSGSAWA